MPLYEYICEACRHEFELIQKFSEKPEKTCPACGKKKVIKKVSKAGFQLKGGGWYADGYSKSDKKPESDGKKTSDKSPEGKSDKKAENKSSESKASDSKPGTQNKAA